MRRVDWARCEDTDAGTEENDNTNRHDGLLVVREISIHRLLQVLQCSCFCEQLYWFSRVVNPPSETSLNLNRHKATHNTRRILLYGNIHEMNSSRHMGSHAVDIKSTVIQMCSLCCQT